MPNTTSAAKRARANARKASHNRSIKSRLKALERKMLTLVKGGKLDDARTALREAASGYDKAAKTGVIKREHARRKRSRLQVRLNAAAATSATASAKPAPAS
jgi:small subunit ribosomal protein S20